MGTPQLRSAAWFFAVPFPLAATFPEHVAPQKRCRAPHSLFIERGA